MYNEDDKYLDEIDKALNDYTRKEFKIYSTNVFEELLNRYPNKEEIEVYRGLNFKTKLEFIKFMKKLENEGGTITSNYAAGYSPNYKTALGFAESPKTYFPSLEIVKAEAKRNKEHERLSGYCGVILTTKAQKGTVVDISESDHGIESEVLFKPNLKIKVSIEIIINYKDTLKQKDFDLNKYVQSTTDLEDPLLTYITFNNAEKLNALSSEHLFNLCLNFPKSKNPDVTFINNYIGIINRKTLSYGDIMDNYELCGLHYLPLFEKRGCFRLEQYSKIKEICNQSIVDFIDTYHNYEKDNKKISNYSEIQWFTKFANKEINQRYKEEILNKNGDEYHRLNNSFRELNKKGLTNEELHKEAKKIANDIKITLQNIIDSAPKERTRTSKRLSGIKK